MELFTQSALEQFNARLTEHPGRYQAIHLPGEAGTVTLTMDVIVSDKLQGVIVRRVLDVAKLANSLQLVTANQNLSDQGKTHQRRSIDTERAKLAALLDGDARQVDDLAFVAKLAEEELYRPEPIERGDVVTALDDQSIKSHWAAMEPLALDAALKDGQLTLRHLEALKRSPVRLREPLQSIVDERWEQHLETDLSKRWESVQDDRSSAAWAVAAIGQIRQAVERLAFHDRQAIRPAPEEMGAA